MPRALQHSQAKSTPCLLPDDLVSLKVARDGRIARVCCRGLHPHTVNPINGQWTSQVLKFFRDRQELVDLLSISETNFDAMQQVLTSDAGWKQLQLRTVQPERRH